MSSSKSYLAIIFYVTALSLLQSCVTTTESRPVYNPKQSSKDVRVDTKVAIALRYLEIGENETAISHLKQALEWSPRSPKVHEALGLAFQRTNDIALANKHFQQALSFDPKYTRGRNNYAVFLFQQGNFAASCKHLKIVVQDVYYDRRSDAYTNLGLCAKNSGDISLARQAFLKAISLNPRHANATLELAYLEFESNNFEQSQKYLKQFHDLVPKGNPQSLLLGYRVAKLFNRQREASIYSRAMYKLYPNAPEAKLLY